MGARVVWTRDNDYDVYIENLPTGLDITVFVSLTRLQAAAAIAASLSQPAVFGVYDIPAIGTDEARDNVSCYKAPFLGADITADAPIDTPLYIIAHDGTKVRRWRALIVRDNEEGDEA